MRTAAAGALLAALAGCASGSPGSGAPGGVRFALEVDGADEPVWIQLVSESEPVAWVRVSGEAGRLYLEPRCEIPDCGEPAAVCGAALPRVRRLADAGRAGSVGFAWDGTTSVETAEGCERRVPAEPGAYTARFCWASRAETEGAGDPSESVVGRLAEPTCTDRAFELGRDTLVVVRVS